MLAEISYDLVMGSEMAFVEGTYRLPGGEWQVFVFSRRDILEPIVKHARFGFSGVSGIYVEFPSAMALNQAVVEQLLARILDVGEWTVVRGPDSISLR